MDSTENVRKKFIYELQLTCEKPYMKTYFELFDYIVDGNVGLVSKRISTIFSDEEALMSTIQQNFDTLDSFKQKLHSLNLCCLNASRLGQLPGQAGKILHKSYHITINRISSYDRLVEHVLKTMASDYAEMVNKFSTDNYSETITSIVDYILMHINEELVLQDIGDIFSIHPVHLARKFKQETGRTFVKYITAQRIYLAKFLIFDEQIALSDISVLCGFNSQSYFSKVFKKETGRTPTRYAHEVHNIVFV